MKNLTWVIIVSVFLPFLGGCVRVTVHGLHTNPHRNYRTYCDACHGYDCGNSYHRGYYRMIEGPRHRISSRGHHHHPHHHSTSTAPRQTQRRMTTRSYQSSNRTRQETSRSRIQRQATQPRRTAYRQSTQEERVEKRRATTKKRRR